jgi:hypothetical protein
MGRKTPQSWGERPTRCAGLAGGLESALPGEENRSSREPRHFQHAPRGVAGKCLPEQSLGMAPVKAPRTRQFRGTGWPSEGQKRTLCPTGTRRARFPAGPLGDHWAEDLVAADGSPQPAAAGLSPTEPLVRGDYCRRGVPQRRQNRSLTPPCAPQIWQYTGEASDTAASPSGRLAVGRCR